MQPFCNNKFALERNDIHNDAALVYQKLTLQQQKVLQCIALGSSCKAIAAKLGITLNTVKNHLKHIYKKTSVNTMAQAIPWYYTLGVREERSKLQRY